MGCTCVYLCVWWKGWSCRRDTNLLRPSPETTKNESFDTRVVFRYTEEGTPCEIEGGRGWRERVGERERGDTRTRVRLSLGFSVPLTFSLPDVPVDPSVVDKCLLIVGPRVGVVLDSFRFLSPPSPLPDPHYPSVPPSLLTTLPDPPPSFGPSLPSLPPEPLPYPPSLRSLPLVLSLLTSLPDAPSPGSLPPPSHPDPLPDTPFPSVLPSPASLLTSLRRFRVGKVRPRRTGPVPSVAGK